jgi:uncharacterized protein (DUF1778 family)
VARLAARHKRSPRSRAHRLEARVTREQKSLFQRAADLQGRTLTDFVVASLQEVAAHTIRDREALALSLRDRDRFIKALLKPPAPNARLVEAAKRHRQLTGG